MARSTTGVVITSRLNTALRAIPVVLALACAACTTQPARVVTDYCTPWRPIYVSKQDVLTDGTAKQIRAHDITGARLCNWKPRKD